MNQSEVNSMILEIQSFSIVATKWPTFVEDPAVEETVRQLFKYLQCFHILPKVPQNVLSSAAYLEKCAIL